MSIFTLVPSPIITFPLPYRNAGTSWKKTTPNGSIKLASAAGVPYGLYGRLGLITLTNLAFAESIKTFSVYKLLRLVKPKKITGIQLQKFESALNSWGNTLITFSSLTPTKQSFRNLLLVKEGEFRLKKDCDHEHEVSLVFTEEGKSFLTENAVPIPSDAVQEIDSAFDFDVLSWLIISLFLVYQKKEVLVPWSRLRIQFGISSKNSGHFRTCFEHSIRDLADAFYPQANFFVDEKGVYLLPSPLLIAKPKDLMLPAIEQNGGES